MSGAGMAAFVSQLNWLGLGPKSAIFCRWRHAHTVLYPLMFLTQIDVHISELLRALNQFQYFKKYLKGRGIREIENGFLVEEEQLAVGARSCGHLFNTKHYEDIQYRRSCGEKSPKRCLWGGRLLLMLIPTMLRESDSQRIISPCPWKHKKIKDSLSRSHFISTRREYENPESNMVWVAGFYVWIPETGSDRQVWRMQRCS